MLLMSVYYKVLLFLAVIPGFYLLYKVYKWDTVEKEPMGLIIRLVIAGVISTIPAMILEVFIDGVFAGLGFDSGFFYNLISCFMGVALIEELCKYLLLRIFSWRSKAFDYVFDGIVYGVCVGVGFAVFENVLYVFDSGIALAIQRALTAVPAHVIFGIYMGHNYGLAKQCEKHGDTEGKKAYLMHALLMPILLHGFYDFCLTEGTLLTVIIFYVFIIWLDKKAIRDIKRFSQQDELL